MTTKIKHPFQGGVKKSTVTVKHKPLIWENMLGTVYARSPQGLVKYFDYDWTGAYKFAQVNNCVDLRIAKNKSRVSNWPSVGKVALWGILQGV